MGRRAPRFNEKARSSSRPSTALPHPRPRDAPDTVEKSKKMSKKKRLRFEKFVEKQLKKENRVLLMDKLKDIKSSHLFQSSKDLGRAKLTAKEKLKVALNEFRQGISCSVSDAKLFIENDALMEDMDSQSDHVEAHDKMSTLSAVKKGGNADLTLFNQSCSEDEEAQEEDCLQDRDQVINEPTEANQSCSEEGPKNHKEVQNKPAFYVPVNRSKDMSVARMSLPVVGEEQIIMETIMENDVTVLCSETGSGKTTQLPQFLYEAGFGHPDHLLYSGMIGITQPRRVAAVSMAARVGHEMNLFNGEVSYQIRYDKGKLNRNTRILFMTDGILLRQLSQGGNSAESSGLLLPEYSCIIIDEAHERTVGTDILLGWLTRVVKLRNSGRIAGINPLKLVIMSATLRVEDFTENKALFQESPPPVINIPGRQHKVVVHYNRHTQSDYVSEAFRKAVKIHTRFPPGGILIFVTGQQEVQILVRKLRKEFCAKEISDGFSDKKTDVSDFSLLEENQNESEDDYEPENSSEIDSESVISEEDNVEILNGTIEDEDIEMLTEMSESEIKTRGPMHVLPLYSLLPKDAQLRVFEPPPDGSRLVVVATNIAETSLTLPGIKYVIDSGKSKERLYDPKTGLQRFCIDWTSKAAADQRAGRAGRTGPGHCFRLYSSAVFGNHFPEFAKPEILRAPLEGVILQMKAVGIKNVLDFPFPTLPDRAQLKASHDLLKHLGALDDKDNITSLGRQMSCFPISPRYAKMLTVASKQSQSILEHMISVVCGLSVGSPFVHMDFTELEDSEEMEDDDKRRRRASYYRIQQQFAGKIPKSDALKLLTAIGAYRFHNGNKKEFCESQYLSLKTMEEIDKLCGQILKIAHKVLETPPNFTNSKPPSQEEKQKILQILLVGNPDRIARLVNIEKNHGIYETIDCNNLWRIHSSSCIFTCKPPSWIVYLESSAKGVCMSSDQESILGSSNDKFYLNLVTEIQPNWISSLITKPLIQSGKILEQPAPKYDSSADIVTVYVSPNYGPKSWPLSIQSRPLLPQDPEAPLIIARFLLQGKLFPDLEFPRLRFNPSLLSSARALLLGKPWILNLLSSLQDVTCASDFHKKWSVDPDWLYSQLLEWIYPENIKEFKLQWKDKMKICS